MINNTITATVLSQIQDKFPDTSQLDLSVLESHVLNQLRLSRLQCNDFGMSTDNRSNKELVKALSRLHLLGLLIRNDYVNFYGNDSWWRARYKNEAMDDLIGD